MASSSTCQYCSATIRSDQQSCPGCGAPNPNYVPPKSGGSEHKPRTIAELQAFCAERGMPLQKMRFFIGEDYRGPRAFGIYQEGPDFVVYKNKADGSRAERYRGPDEAYAVNELFQKLKEEHLMRQRAAGRGSTPPSRGGGGGGRRGGGGSKLPSPWNRILLLIVLLGIVAFFAWGFFGKSLNHRNDGYYRAAGDLFYRYGSSWYVDDGYGGWYETDYFPEENYEEYYEGGSYDSSWGGSDFQDSDEWEDLHDSSDSYSSYDDDDDWSWDSSDDDYDSWDSYDSDWDSDW